MQNHNKEIKNQKVNNLKNSNTKNDKKVKIVIKNKAKFRRAIFVILLLVIIIVVLFNLIFGNKKINEKTNISNLNESKYASEIKSEYEKDNENLEKVNLFISTQNKLQSDTYNYFYSTNSEEDKYVKQKYINERFDSGNISEFSDVDISYWNGKWFCDEYGNVKFKFASKNIEPNWVTNSRLDGYIEFN